MNKSTPSPIGFLSSKMYVEEFDRWSRENIPTYSRRAFARRADISSPNFLTLIISGKRPFQKGWLQKFIKSAKLNQEESTYLSNLVQFESTKNGAQKSQIYHQLKGQIFSKKVLHNLKSRELYLISSLYIWGIYIALNIPCSGADQAKFLSKKIGKKKSLLKIREVFKNFKKLELVEVIHP